MRPEKIAEYFSDDVSLEARPDFVKDLTDAIKTRDAETEERVKQETMENILKVSEWSTDSLISIVTSLKKQLIERGLLKEYEDWANSPDDEHNGCGWHKRIFPKGEGCPQCLITGDTND